MATTGKVFCLAALQNFSILCGTMSAVWTLIISTLTSLSHTPLETCSSSYTAINYFAWQSCRALWNGVQLVSSQFFVCRLRACFSMHRYAHIQTDTNCTYNAYCIDKNECRFIGGIPTILGLKD